MNSAPSISSTHMEEDLSTLCRGGVGFDSYHRSLYSSDASIYTITPLGVVFPKDEADVVRVVRYAAEHQIPLLPRGGGSGLAGQTVGRAIVIDFTRHMRNILHFDPILRRIRVQPGLVLDELNRFLKPHGLKFAPDPASSAQAAIGGMIGNNSTGGRSLIYGKTDAYLHSLRVVLPTGQVMVTKDVPLSDIQKLPDPTERMLHQQVFRVLSENAAEIDLRYPKIKRNVGGYNLPHVVHGESINLSRLFAGSEGTLVVTTEAELDLVPIPKHANVILLCFKDLIPALESVTGILKLQPSAVELVDDIFLDLAAKVEGHRDLVRQLPEGTRTVLLVEFCGDHLEGISDSTARLLQEFSGTGRPSFQARVAGNAAEREKIWALRKAALPILASRAEDTKYVEFIEDATVPPEHLPAYVRDFRAILAKHGTQGSFYAHAGPGCLHVRPLLNLKQASDVEKMFHIGNEVTDAVIKYHGAVSGEHGDGLSKTQWNKKMYGPRICQVFKEIKHLFDPQGIMNPGKIVSDDTDLRQNLREGPDFHPRPMETTLDFSDQVDIAHAIELCNGCGGCRNLQGGTMCPTYRATGSEIMATRGRANMLRLAITGVLPEDTLTSPAFREEVLDLCIGCKACARECPSGVDMAKLKMELLHLHHQEHGLSLRDHMLAAVRTTNRIGSLFSPLSNLVKNFPPVRWIMEGLTGIDHRRPLPDYVRCTFEQWFKSSPHPNPAQPSRKVVLFVDCFTNHHEPSIPAAATRILEACGCEVRLVSHGCCGRTLLSKGMLDEARRNAEQLLSQLLPWIEKGYDIVGCEPSCVTALQEDYLSFHLGEPAKLMSGRTYEIMEYLNGPARDLLEKLLKSLPPHPANAPTKKLAYHGHCHQKAQGNGHHAAEVLARAPGMDVTFLDTGCCGMAGSFGYEKEHYALSMGIAQDLFSKIKRHQGDAVAASGFSCRCQVRDGLSQSVQHPVEILAGQIIGWKSR